MEFVRAWPERVQRWVDKDPQMAGDPWMAGDDRDSILVNFGLLSAPMVEVW
jgi:hypothetical protein